ncbi:MAG: TolC family protein [Bacteroidota bacterium]
MRTVLLTAAAIVGGIAAAAQDAPATAPADTQQFTLQQAQAYALENNFQNQRSALEVEQAQKQIAEVRAIGLPQINGEVRVQNYLDIPTNRALATAFDPNAPEGELAEFQFALQYNNALGVSINQVVFDGSYIVVRIGYWSILNTLATS